ncbi:hypothetical protein [Nostoc sp.]|uniref:hypothetical protein n=1 Tax=Nostoc sp. TaxID=1180 RepID=UPI002FFB1D2A
MTSESVGVGVASRREARRRHRQKELDRRKRLLREQEVELRFQEMETNIHPTRCGFSSNCEASARKFPETLDAKSDSGWEAVCSWCGSAGCSQNSLSGGWIYYYCCIGVDVL